MNTMKEKKKTVTVKRYAVLFVVLVCLIVFTLHAFYIWRAYQKDVISAQKDVKRISHAFTLYAEETLNNVDILLQNVALRMESVAPNTGTLREIKHGLAAQVSMLSYLDDIQVYNLHGTPLLVIDPDTSLLTDALHESILRQHRQADNSNLVFSPPFKNLKNGEWLMPVSMRFNKPGRNFGGYVIGLIRIRYFERFYSIVGMPLSGALVLGKQDGSLLFRYPFPDSELGLNILNTSLFHRIMSAPADEGILYSQYDKQMRFGAYEYLQKYPLFAATTVETNILMKAWLNDTLEKSAIVIPVTIFFALMGMFLIRQIAIRARIENDLVHAKYELQSVNNMLQKLALEDGLTGLPNRRHFDTAFKNEFLRAIREETCISVLLIDVDLFKKYNDTYGHQEGDKCLQRIASCLVTKRSGDLSARYGGEEFVLLLPNTNQEGAFSVAQGILDRVSGMQIPHSASSFGVVTVSIGIYSAIPYRDKSKPEDWVKNADMALYQAKSLGRCQIQAFT